MNILHFTCHDVLQSTNFSHAELTSLAIKPFFEWFKEATEPFENDYLKLVVVAEGIDSQPEWVEYIKAHKNWEVQVHCWEHKIMNHMEEADLYREIKMAKNKIEQTFNQRCTQFFPPKHCHSEIMWRVCRSLDLSLMFERYIPMHYFKYRNIPEVYFHYWQPSQIKEVKEILNESR